MSHQFKLRFPVNRLRRYAEGYSYAEDDAVIAIGMKAQERGHLTGPEFRAIGDWKSTRQRSNRKTNTNTEVEELTRISFSAVTERARIGVLLCLHGVSWPTASVLLHLCHREEYPILDVRAIWSLGIDGTPSYSHTFWMGYLDACRNLSVRTGFDMRTVDRALWQYSKENQGAL